MNKITEKIGAWLLVPGNTKSELAKKLSISTGTLNNRLSGTYEWTWSEVCALADALDCSLETFRQETAK